MDQLRQGRGFLVSAVAIALAGVLAMLLVAPGLAFASEESAAGPFAAAPVLGGAAEVLVPGGALLAAEARASSPEAVSLRESSQSAYEGLGPQAAQRLVSETWPGLVARPDGGPPLLPSGAKAEAFLSAHAERIALAGGQPAVVESLAPIAVQSGGAFSPLELGLGESSGAFAPRRGAVQMKVAKSLSEGVSLPELGLSLTPLEESGGGAAEAGPGELDGDAVFWGGSSMGTDVDAMARATPTGVDLLASLRSARSPQSLRYRIGAPEGASVVQPVQGGPVDVMEVGRQVAQIPVPSAVDAEGMPVPVVLGLSGDVVSVTLPESLRRYRLPVLVDPEFDSTTETRAPGNWSFKQREGGGYTDQLTPTQMYMSHGEVYPKEDWGIFSTQTKGDSKIYETSAAVQLVERAPVEAWAEIEKVNVEYMRSPAVELGDAELTVCAAAGCVPSAGAEKNAALIEAMTTESSEQWKATSGFFVSVTGETNYLSQPKETHSTVQFNTAAEVDKTVDVVDGRAWFGPKQGALEYTAHDLGLGVSGINLERYVEGKWQVFNADSFLDEGWPGEECIGVECAPERTEALTYDTKRKADEAEVGSGLPEGDDTIRVSAHDAMSGSASTEWERDEVGLDVDAQPPYGITVGGIKREGETYVLGEVMAKVAVQATDGMGSTPSSGVKSIEVAVDGVEQGKANGSCQPGPCTATGEWEISGSELGAGMHTLTVQAIDNAGNVAKREFLLEVYPASPVALGPGSVNPESGDFALEASDVSMSGGTGNLSVTRHYDSLNTTEGKEGPLGPQWTISLGSLASLEELPDGSMMMVGPSGLAHFAKKTGGGFESPSGDGNLKLEAKSEERELDGYKYLVVNEYVLKDSKEGTSTRFTKPEGASSWMPTVSEGPTATDTTADSYQTVEIESKKIVEPKLEVAPHPNATCTVENLERGCRALTFNYAEATTAKGEAPGEWGDYKGDLTRVYFHAWDPVSKAMKTILVAHYLYDGKGRLRAEWDPRTEPEGEKCVKEPTASGCLVTIYGYDSEGHVTSIATAGQQPWLVRYGTTESDSRAGRVLSVSRPKANVSLESVSLGAPSNAEAPSLSSQQLRTGQSVSVNVGKWTDGLAYSYQWEDCQTKENPTKCALIPGAVDASYTPRPSDELKYLRAIVTASDADGSTSVASPAVLVPATFYAPTYASSFTGCGLSKPSYAVITKYGGKEVLAVSSTGNEGVVEFGMGGECVLGLSSHGSEPTGVAASEGLGCDLWVADSGSKEVACFTEHDDYYQEKESHVASPLGGMAYTTFSGGGEYLDQASSSQVATYTGPTLEYKKSYGTEGSASGDMKHPADVKTGGSGELDVADTGNDRVDVFAKGTLAGGELGEWIGSVGEAGTGNGQLTSPLGVAAEAVGAIWVADTGNDRVEVFTRPKQESLASLYYGASPGQYLGQFGKGSMSEPVGILTSGFPGLGAGQGAIYVVDKAANKVEKWLPGAPPAEPSLPAAEPPNEPELLTSTVEYGVPVSGAGAPYELGAKEAEAWAQKDDPVYATAILPVEHPQGWPAKSYQGATVYYLDSHARTVNVASPSGGIATTEYNENDEVVRALSADDRARALEAGTSSAKESGKLDTESNYNTQTGELTETIGPEHQVKLSDGEVVQARNHVGYKYDEGAPEGEESGLVTKITDGALVAGHTILELKDVRETVTDYSGQNDLGWKLREPTSSTTDPKGVDLVHTTIYDPSTGDVVETRAPGAGAAGDQTGKLLGSFGGQESYGPPLSGPRGVAVDAHGDLWIADTENSRILEISPTGEYLQRFGSEGSGDGQLKHPKGIAIDSEGDVWVADTGNNRIEEFSSTGKYLQQFGEVGEVATAFSTCVSAKRPLSECEEYDGPRYSKGKGAFKEPADVVVNGKDIYVVDTGNRRVQEAGVLGEYVAAFGEGSLEAPEAAVINASGDLWVGSGSHLRQYTPSGTLSKTKEAFGPVHGLSIGTGGDLWAVGGTYPYAIKYSPEGAVLTLIGKEGSGEGQLKGPAGIVASGSDLWVADTGNNRVQELSETGTYVRQFGSPGSDKELRFEDPAGGAVDSKGDLWIADTGNDRIQETTSEGSFVRSFGQLGAGNGALAQPLGVTVDSAGHVWVADTGNDRVQEFSSEGAYLSQFGSAGTGNGQFKEPAAIAATGEDLYIVDRGNARIQELSDKGSFVRAFGTEGEGKLSRPQGITIDKEGHVWVTDSGTGRVVEFSALGVYLGSFGTKGSEQGQFTEPMGIQATEAGDLWVADAGDGRVQEFTPQGSFLQQLAAKSQFDQPAGLALDSATSQLAVINRGNATIQRWQPGNSGHEAEGQGGVHSSVSVYYTATANTQHPECGEHIEWVGLPCENMAGKQPETPGLPPLPITRIEYNVYDQPEKTIETFGSVTRTRTTTYSEAGWPLSATLSAGAGKAMPTVSDKYSPSTGALLEQSSEGRTIKRSYNSLGQMTSYTDADGNTTEYLYDQYGRLHEVLYDTNLSPGPEGAKQIYAYSETTGALVEINDSSAGAFKASYGVEGNITSETYPNGMLATYTHNSIGEATSLSYEKTTTGCTEKCVWFSDSITPSIHGEARTQQNSLAKNEYAYTEVGQLKEVQETPTGEGCTVRTYTYDIEGNRTSQGTRKPAAEGKCATEGGETQTHTYDAANRLTDEGVTYDALGDITKLPAADAGGSAIESEYYADGQLAGQTQNKQSDSYMLDPEGRTRQTETLASNGEVTNTVSHYAGPGGLACWSINAVSAKWMRQISGFGGMVAIQESGHEPVLQISDLQGNIVATASIKPEATKLLTEERSTEYGVPVTEKPADKYSWLGAAGLTSAFPSTGTIAQDGTTYVPQIGQGLQTAPTAPPIPANNADPYFATEESWVAQGGAAAAAQEEALYEERIRKIKEAQEAAMAAIAPWKPNEEEEEGEGLDLYDPEGLASYKRTLGRAKELEQDATNGFLLGLAADVVVDGAAETGAEYAGQMIESADNLKECVAIGKGVAGKKGKYGVCFINEWRVPVLAWSIPWGATAEFCSYFGQKSWSKKTHNVYYCEASKVLTWGPWF